MVYSISEVAKEMQVNVSTLRYYDHIGLFQKLKKDDAGNRTFTKEDIEVLRIIQYLKKAGMQLTEIKQFMVWCKQGDATLEKRLNLFKKQKEKVEEQIKELKKTLSLIEFKEWYYSNAVKDGSNYFYFRIFYYAGKDFDFARNDLGIEENLVFQDGKTESIEYKMIDKERTDGVIHFYFISKDDNTFVLNFVSQNDIHIFEEKVLESIKF